MLKIRLKRVGRKNDPSFRIIVAESTQGPKSGNFVEQVGFYNPRTKEKRIDGERITHWINKGAHPSDTLHNMLVTEKIIEGKKINVLPKKRPIGKDTPPAPAEIPPQAPVQNEVKVEEQPTEEAPAEPESAPEVGGESAS